jgi:transposase
MRRTLPFSSSKTKQYSFLYCLPLLEQTVREFEAQIEAALALFRAAVERLMTIPGVSATAASVIIAEIGVDIGRFATAGYLRSWAGLCPQLGECRQDHVAPAAVWGPWLKTVLVQCAWQPPVVKTTIYMPPSS